MVTRIFSIVPLLIITLCCIGVVEGSYTVLEYLVLQPKVRTAVVTPQTASPASAQKRESVYKYGYQIILARNLFAAVPGSEASRMAAMSNSLENLEATGLGVVLMGTIGDNEGGNRAIILDKKTLEQQLYRQGDGVHGAVIKEIRRGKVVIALNGRDEILDMREAAKLHPEPKTGDSSRTGALQPDNAQAQASEKGTLEEPPTEEQQSPPKASSGPEPAAKRIIRPLILRPVRTPDNN